MDAGEEPRGRQTVMSATQTRSSGGREPRRAPAQAAAAVADAPRHFCPQPSLREGPAPAALAPATRSTAGASRAGGPACH